MLSLTYSEFLPEMVWILQGRSQFYLIEAWLLLAQTCNRNSRGTFLVYWRLVSDKIRVKRSFLTKLKKQLYFLTKKFDFLESSENNEFKNRRFESGNRNYSSRIHIISSFRKTDILLDAFK